MKSYFRSLPHTHTHTHTSMGVKQSKPEEVHKNLEELLREATQNIKSGRRLKGEIESLKRRVGANENLLSILESFAFAVNTIYVQATVGGLGAVAKETGVIADQVMDMAGESWECSMRCLDEFIKENMTSINVYQAELVQKSIRHQSNAESKCHAHDLSSDDEDGDFDSGYGSDWDGRTSLLIPMDEVKSFVVRNTTLVFLSRAKLDEMYKESVRLISEYFLEKFNPFQENLKEAIADQMTTLEQLEKQLKEIQMKATSNEKKRVNCGTNVYQRHRCPDHISKRFVRNSVNKLQEFRSSPVKKDAWKAFQLERKSREEGSLDSVSINPGFDHGFAGPVLKKTQQRRPKKPRLMVTMDSHGNIYANSVPIKGEDATTEFAKIIGTFISSIKDQNLKFGKIEFPSDYRRGDLNKMKDDVRTLFNRCLSLQDTEFDNVMIATPCD